MIFVTLLMRVFANNHDTARGIFRVAGFSNVLFLSAAVYLPMQLLGDDFGTLWLIASILLFIAGKLLYLKYLTPYSTDKLKTTHKFFREILKASFKR